MKLIFLKIKASLASISKRTTEYCKADYEMINCIIKERIDYNG